VKTLDASELLKGYLQPLVMARLDPEAWPLFPPVELLVARGDVDGHPGRAGRIQANYGEVIERALEQAPYAALILDPRRLIVAPFELRHAVLDPDGGEEIPEPPDDLLTALPEETLVLPPLVVDAELLEPAPASVYYPPLEEAARRIGRSPIDRRYPDAPDGVAFVRQFGGHLVLPAYATGEEVAGHLERALTLLAFESPHRARAWREVLAPLLADPRPLVGRPWLFLLYRPKLEAPYELIREPIPGDLLSAARPQPQRIEALVQELARRFDHPRAFAEAVLGHARDPRPPLAWVYLPRGTDPHREEKRAFLARSGLPGLRLLEALDRLPARPSRPVLVVLYEGSDRAIPVYSETPFEVAPAPDWREEVHLETPPMA